MIFLLYFCEEYVNRRLLSSWENIWDKFLTDRFLPNPPNPGQPLQIIVARNNWATDRFLEFLSDHSAWKIVRMRHSRFSNSLSTQVKRHSRSSVQKASVNTFQNPLDLKLGGRCWSGRSSSTDRGDHSTFRCDIRLLLEIQASYLFFKCYGLFHQF